MEIGGMEGMVVRSANLFKFTLTKLWARVIATGALAGHHYRMMKQINQQLVTYQLSIMVPHMYGIAS